MSRGSAIDKPRTFLCLAMLCVLSLFLSAIATQSASAQGIYTCGVGLGSVDFTDSHCKSHVSPGTGTWGHQYIPGQWAFTITNGATGTERSIAKLKSVQSGVTLELQATVVSGSGTMENKEEGGQTWGEGTGTIIYENATVTAPAGKGCEVEGGKVVTKKLSVSTKGLTNQVKISPAEGETVGEFAVKGCSIGALNHSYTAKGSVAGNTEGATTTTTHSGVTAAKSLTLSGQQAGIEGSITTISFFTGNAIVQT